jgi:PAS domain S-box-containing protein
VLERVGGTRNALLLIGVAGLYLGAAKVGLELSVAQGVITPVWAPTGISLAAAVLFGRRVWPAVAIGAFVANATSGAEVPVAAAIAVGNTLEAVVGAALLRRVGFRPALDRVRDVFALVFFGATLSTAISATNGVTTLLIAGDTSGHEYGSDWLLWWIGDGMGDLVVAPLLLVWATAIPRGLPRIRQLEGLCLLALLIAVGWFVFLAGYWRYPHLLFPLLIWAVLRFRQAGAVAASFVVASIAIAGAVHGSVPFGQGSATHTVQILEALLAGITASLLILGAVLAERETAEERLVGAHASLAEAQEVAHIGSWEWNIAEDGITWSDELYRLYGLDPELDAITYEGYLGRLHPDDAETIRKTVERAYADGRAFAFDHRIVLDDGSVRWVHGRGRVVRDAGRVVRMVGTSQDITDRKRLDELRDTILSTVSHELRTPLTAILGFALTLKEHGTRLTAGTYAEVVDHLTDQANRLEQLLSDLLDLDRLRHGALTPTFRPTDVGELVARVASGYGGEEHLILIEADRAVAEIDAPKVERIVENLLGNAVKHTPPGTEIRVRVSPDGDGVVLAVEDRGPGIAPDEREAVFEVFTRGDGTGAPGTGIGLSLVAQFAALHGGRAWVEDNPGGGASFRVRLPVRQEP